MGTIVSTDRHGNVTITWDDPHDAMEAGFVLRSAGLQPSGSIFDRGFYGDGNALIEAADSVLAGQADER